MDHLVFYSEGLDPEIVRSALTGVEVLTVYSRSLLIESLVDAPSLVGAVINVAEMTPHWAGFLASASRSFPLLPILVIRPAGTNDCPDGLVCLDDDASAETIQGALDDLVGGAPQRDRREHHRYEWPLRATLTGGDGTVHRVSEISAGGAYLESAGSSVGSGQVFDLQIHFQNFKMQVRCAILDPRHSSSRRSAGFGVRFVDLSDEAVEFVNRIVQDTLIKVLIDPSASPAVPSLDEDEDLLSIGDEFSLT